MILTFTCILNTEKSVNTGIPELTVVIILNFEQGGISKQQCLLKMSKEWQTV